MNNRQRVGKALGHERPDKVPYDILFTQDAHAKMARFYGKADFASTLGNCLTMLSTEPWEAYKEVAPGVWEDAFGVRWDRRVDHDIGIVANRLVAPENVGEVRFPDPEDPSRYDWREMIEAHRNNFVLATLGFSLFERAWGLAGMEEVLMAMILDKGFVHALLDRILEFNLKVIARACKAEVDGMLFGDDWGQQKGLLMGPGLWREFIKPRVRKMYDLVKSAGKSVFIHCCGNVEELFPDLIECGVDVFNPFQPEVMDVFKLKREYGRDISFYGGISTQKTLPYGSVSEVREEVRRLITIVGDDGGYIAAPAHSVTADARPENVAAMIEVLQNQ